jgi:hypothetical protein
MRSGTPEFCDDGVTVCRRVVNEETSVVLVFWVEGDTEQTLFANPIGEVGDIEERSVDECSSYNESDQTILLSDEQFAGSVARCGYRNRLGQAGGHDLE